MSRLPAASRAALAAFVALVCLSPSACRSSGAVASPNGGSSPAASSLQSSLRKIDAHPLYTLDYVGDYDALVNTVPQREEEFGVTAGASEVEVPELSFADECTLFSALGGSGRLYGRNRDMPSDASATLVLFTTPSDGAASVSLVDLTSIGYRSDTDAGQLAVAPLLIRDGMNAYGLAISKADVEFARPRVYDPARPYRNFMTAMREVLDHGRNVPEALAVLGRFNVVFPGVGGHYLVADAAGASAVVEFDGAEMRVVPSSGPWQVATNFVVGGAGGFDPDWRYVEASRRLSEAGGIATQAQTLETLQAVSVPGHTLWSAAYDLGRREVVVVMGQRFATQHRFSLASAAR